MDDNQFFAWSMVALSAIAVATIVAGVWMLTTYAVVEKTETLEVTSVIVNTGTSASLLKDAQGNIYKIKDPFLAKEISKSMGLYKVKMNPVGLYPIAVDWVISEAERLVG